MPAAVQAAATGPVHTSATLALPSSNTFCMFFTSTTIGVMARNGTPSSVFLSAPGFSPLASFWARATEAVASSWNGL